MQLSHLPTTSSARLRVIHLTRKPQEGFHSFERLFHDIRAALPADIEVRVVHSWFHSRGLIPRLLNCLQALFLRADVIHITGDIHYLVPALLGRRSVLTIHDLAPLRPKTGLARKVFRALWYVLPVRLATAVTTISKSIQSELQEELGNLADKVITVPNCISNDFSFTPKEWPERPSVLMIGTQPQKNIERMCAALVGFSVDVQIIGQLSEGQRERFEQQELSFNELGRLSDAEVLQAYRESDLVAFASTYEGFGLPVLEAQVTGRPVLTSHTSTLREIAGEGACFVDPLEVDSIREGFRRLLKNQDYRTELIDLGLENAKRYSADATAQAYATVYRDIA
ncbi:MAG TPA: hypothetical protein DCX06_10215 [Opitutae bacterium]|nr:hypothetical protein [Opitutae bacterium]